MKRLRNSSEIFKEDDETNVYFLPQVSFRFLFNCEGITETTKKAIWKYLQLMLFAVIKNVTTKDNKKAKTEKRIGQYKQGTPLRDILTIQDITEMNGVLHAI